MALFQFRATNAEGQINKGQIEALHELDLEAQLKRVGLLLISAKALASRRRIVKRMPRREVIDFFFQLEMLVRAGVPILTSLGDLRDESESPNARDLASGLYEKIEAGSTFGEAIAVYPGVFSATIISLIRAGEVTGQLPDVMKEIVRSLKWQDEMASQTKKLLMYPSFVMVVIGGVVFFLMIYLVPQLVGFIKNMGQEIPIQTRLLIGVSQFFVNYWWLLLITPPIGVAITLALSAALPGVRLAACAGAGHSVRGADSQEDDPGALCRHLCPDVPHRHSPDRRPGLLRGHLQQPGDTPRHPPGARAGHQWRRAVGELCGGDAVSLPGDSHAESGRVHWRAGRRVEQHQLFLYT
ncbi:MAG: type II secretion system F family protein [Rhodoferax sp.]|nr:type II secretion system F family protein [Rhodoferax sp.]